MRLWGGYFGRRRAFSPGQQARGYFAVAADQAERPGPAGLGEGILRQIGDVTGVDQIAEGGRRIGRKAVAIAVRPLR